MTVVFCEVTRQVYVTMLVESIERSEIQKFQLWVTADGFNVPPEFQETVSLRPTVFNFGVCNWISEQTNIYIYAPSRFLKKLCSGRIPVNEKEERIPRFVM